MLLSNDIKRRSNAALFFRLAFTALASAVLSLCVISLPALARANDATPNIVIILTDDMGYGDVGVNSNTVIRTPHIDRLARKGLNLSSFYSSANVCTPSRAGLMTGRYAIRSGLAAGVLSATAKGGLPEDEDTIAELAKRAGLATALIGKWHLGAFPDYHPRKHGWDMFYGTPHSNDMANFALFDGDQKIEEPVQQSSLTQRYTDKALEFITAHKSRPFLLMLSHNMPHIPLYASEMFQGRSKAGVYGDVIEELDHSVGRIVKQLRKQKALKNTLIIFTSDNGPFFEGSVAALKGGKGNGWDGGYRVPGIIHWPKTVKGRRTSSALASNLDILPTLADILQQTPKAKQLDGKSLLPLLQARVRGPAQEETRPFYYFNNEEIIGLRTQRWKLLTHAYYRRSLGAFEKFDQLDGFNSGYDMLFDMHGAGSEQYSVASRHPNVVAALKAELIAARKAFKPLMRRPADKTFPE